MKANQVAVYGTLVGDSATWGLGYLDKFKFRCSRFPRITFCPGTRMQPAAISTPNSLNNGIQRSFAELAALARTSTPLATTVTFRYLTAKYRTLEVRVKRPDLSMSKPRGGTTQQQPISRDDRRQRLGTRA